MTRRPCIVLGASGLVGQRLQQRLIKHPLFELKAVSGSKLTAGKRLSEVEWRLEQKRPNLPDIEVLDSNSEHFISDINRTARFSRTKARASGGRRARCS